MMEKSMGASADADRATAVEPVPVSPLRDGIPSALRCIVCGCALENLGGEHNQPSGGTAFATHGHYGSAAFDPMDGSALEINVCDPCLWTAGRKKRVAHYTPPKATRRRMTTWLDAPIAGE